MGDDHKGPHVKQAGPFALQRNDDLLLAGGNAGREDGVGKQVADLRAYGDVNVELDTSAAGAPDSRPPGARVRCRDGSR